MSSRSYQNHCGTWSAPGCTSICYLLDLPGHPSHNVKGIRIVLRLALSLLINPALNWIQSSPSVQFQLCATLIEMVAGDGQQMQLLQTLRNRNGVSCASVLSRDWNMDFHCHLSSNSRGVNRSRSSVLRVHFLFACHIALTRPGSQEARRDNGCWSELQTEAVDWEAFRLLSRVGQTQHNAGKHTCCTINASTNNTVLPFELIYGLI